jgi:hypothetical protein
MMHVRRFQVASQATHLVPIMKLEVIYALSALKNGKTPGENNIYAEVLRLMNIRKLSAV